MANQQIPSNIILLNNKYYEYNLQWSLMRQLCSFDFEWFKVDNLLDILNVATRI